MFAAKFPSSESVDWTDIGGDVETGDMLGVGSGDVIDGGVIWCTDVGTGDAVCG